MTTRKYLRKLLIDSTQVDRQQVEVYHENMSLNDNSTPKDINTRFDDDNNQLMVYRIDLQASIISDFAKIFNQNDEKDNFSDVTIQICGSERCFYAHRWILTFRSEYFRSMLHNNFRESNSHLIEVDDDPYVIEQLLRYIYIGQVHFENVHQLLSLWIAADKYLFEKLSNEILDHICASWLNEYTVIPIYRFARHYNQQRLKKNAFQFLLDFGHRMFDNRILLELDIDELCPLLMDDRFVCIENDLMSFIMAYLTYHHHDDNIQMTTFDENKIPQKYQVKLEDIAIININIDDSADDVYKTISDHINENKKKKFSQEDESRLLRCIRPEALLQMDHLLNSFLLIYDIRLIALWKKINGLDKNLSETMLVYDHDNIDQRFRWCYPRTKQYFSIYSSGLVDFKRKIYFNQIHLNYQSKLKLSCRFFGPRIYLEYSDCDLNDDEDDHWKNVQVKSMEILNRKILILNFPTIVYGQYLRVSLQHDNWICDDRPTSIKVCLNSQLI